MKNKILAVAITLGAISATAANADTLVLNVTGANTLSADWVVSSLGYIGTMQIVNTGTGVTCRSSGGYECEAFQMAATYFPDWNNIYNRIVSWDIYSDVKNAGGSQSYELTNTYSEGLKRQFNLSKTPNHSLNGGVETITLTHK